MDSSSERLNQKVSNKIKKKKQYWQSSTVRCSASNKNI